jgi:hypothetical protein
LNFLLLFKYFFRFARLYDALCFNKVSPKIGILFSVRFFWSLHLGLYK